MLSSSQKQLLCFFWIFLNVIIFLSWYCFQEHNTALHGMQRRKELKSSLCFRLSYMVCLIVSQHCPHPDWMWDFKWWYMSECRGVWSQLMQRLVRNSVVVVVSATGLSCRTCSPAPPHLSSVGNFMHVLFCSVLETKQLLLLLLEGADEMVWAVLVGSY